MRSIQYVGGPRDGEIDRGEFRDGQQLLTLATGEIGDAEFFPTGQIVELAWAVYRVCANADGWHANYQGKYSARELPHQ